MPSASTRVDPPVFNDIPSALILSTLPYGPSRYLRVRSVQVPRGAIGWIAEPHLSGLRTALIDSFSRFVLSRRSISAHFTSIWMTLLFPRGAALRPNWNLRWALWLAHSVAFLEAH